MKKIINILFFMVIIMTLCVNVFAVDINGDGIQDNPKQIVDLNNDGIDDSYRSEKDESPDAQDILIVHNTAPLVYFGWYRTSQMTDPGWDLYQRSIDWADGGSAPANTDVILFTYNGTLDPEISAGLDGIAVYNYLLSTGYNVVEVHHQQDIESLPSSYYSSFDLAIYAWAYLRDATNIVNSGIPFISASAGETDEMGIGTGEFTMHEYRNEFYVVDDSHYITQPYPLGLLTFAQAMWTDASEAAGSGTALVVAEQIIPVSFNIFPASGRMATTSHFDLTLIVEAPGLSVIGVNAALDGSDVTGALVSCVIPGTLISGGQTFRCPRLTGGFLGTGTHNFSVTLTLSDGSTASDTVDWEVKENTEP